MRDKSRQLHQRHLGCNPTNISTDRDSYESLFAEVFSPGILCNVVRNGSRTIEADDIHSMVQVFDFGIAIELNNSADVMLPWRCINGDRDWAIVRNHFQEFLFIVDKA